MNYWCGFVAQSSSSAVNSTQVRNLFVEITSSIDRKWVWSMLWNKKTHAWKVIPSQKVNFLTAACTFLNHTIPASCSIFEATWYLRSTLIPKNLLSDVFTISARECLWNLYRLSWINSSLYFFPHCETPEWMSMLFILCPFFFYGIETMMNNLITQFARESICLSFFMYQRRDAKSFLNNFSR